MIPRIRHGFQRISRFFRSIRFRLSMWFALVLAVILLVFSTLVYYRQATSLREQAAARVNLRLRDLDSNLRRSLREDESGGWLQVPGTTPGSRFVLQTYEILILADDAGMPARSWGLILADEVVDLSALAPNREGGKMFTVRLKSIPLSEELQDEFEAWSSQLGESSLQEKNEIPPREYLFITAPVGYEDRLLGWVIFGQPVDPEGQLPRLRITLGLAGGLTLLGALLGSYWLAYRALSPVHAITRTAREINDTDLSRRLNIRSHDELGELAGTFDNMLDRLESAFNRQRRFTADASHELRTPLTIIGLETSRALEPGRSLSDVQQSLQVIQSENEFMSRLVNELLTLARMDSGQVQLQHDSIDLGDLALEVVERLTSLAQRKNIRIETGDLPEIRVSGDRQYLGIAIGNLIDNAIKYSLPRPGQWVKVEVGENNGKAWVRVADNGPGIDPEHLPHLFERFFRVDQARSHNPEAASEALDNNLTPGEIPGSGLGLSIVQWIMTMHHGQVSVQSEVGKGSTFELHLPGGNSSIHTTSAEHSLDHLYS